MHISTLEYAPGKKIRKHLGLVQGSTVRSKHVGRDLMAGLKNIFGGELKGYTELLHDSREEAMGRMVEQAEGQRGAQHPLFHFVGGPGGGRALCLRYRSGAGVGPWI
jgi:uncharacterized protein YbjQ (UPF0145 family)